jgi:peptide subunit release factor 1 (eRF1)
MRFHGVLPSLAQKHGVKIEVVTGEAAERLQAAGGIGAWLRTPKGAKPLTAAAVAR